MLYLPKSILTHSDIASPPWQVHKVEIMRLFPVPHQLRIHLVYLVVVNLLPCRLVILFKRLYHRLLLLLLRLWFQVLHPMMIRLAYLVVVVVVFNKLRLLLLILLVLQLSLLLLHQHQQWMMIHLAYLVLQLQLHHHQLNQLLQLHPPLPLKRIHGQLLVLEQGREHQMSLKQQHLRLPTDMRRITLPKRVKLLFLWIRMGCHLMVNTTKLVSAHVRLVSCSTLLVKSRIRCFKRFHPI
mmetsp:Transcript_25826/g.51815  ORF Transcript_25826/g.51815 Transcript_25826/m.51815 type:complete len:239 (-) Transcript_25826:864-1580(-)